LIWAIGCDATVANFAFLFIHFGNLKMNSLLIIMDDEVLQVPASMQMVEKVHQVVLLVSNVRRYPYQQDEC
jgi:hypothetical protein